MDTRDSSLTDRLGYTPGTLQLEITGRRLTITLNRPEKLNALNRAMVRELRELFQALYWDNHIRVVVLRAEGRAFCAGLDLSEASGERPDRPDISEMLTQQRSLAEVYVAMRRCPQPIVACVQGAASGGGMALALASDVRLLTPDARMNSAFIKIGLSACDMGVSYFLPRMIGLSRASACMLTGRFIQAADALQMGLASEVVPVSEIAAAADGYCEDMLNATPLGLRLTKDALNHTVDAAGLEQAMAIEDRNQMLTAADPNFREGMAAFLQKRRPDYA